MNEDEIRKMITNEIIKNLKVEYTNGVVLIEYDGYQIAYFDITSNGPF